MNMNTFTSSRKANITVSNYLDVTPDIINGSNLSGHQKQTMLVKHEQKSSFDILLNNPFWIRVTSTRNRRTMLL
jgi:hypothetical protein